MSFSFTDEQEEFRGVLRRFLQDKSPTTEVRRLMATDTGYDPAVWRAIADELGLPGVHIDEEYGGQGFGFVELGIVLEEMGRALACAPYFATTAMAATAIMNAATATQKRDWLPDLAAGRKLATLAVTEAHGDWRPARVTTTARPADGGVRLDGEKLFVVDAMVADHVIVAARTGGTAGDDGIGLYLVDTNDAGVQRRALQVLDPTRKLGVVRLDGARAELLGKADNVGALRLTLQQSATMLASECAGGAQRMLDSAVDYTLTRVQFGRLIGSFQAVKHACAELLLDVELAKSGAYYAAAAAAAGDADLPALSSLAKASTSDTFMRAAATCIQLHGGIGFTWEQDTHLWYKRAKSAEVFLGTPDFHRALLMDAWLPAGTEAAA